MKPLYDTDFYSWLQEQARLLEQGQANQCDLDNLIEEVEDMGKRHLQKLDSHLTELLMHLLKWQYQPQKREYGHSWENSIRAHRKQARDLIEKYPSLEAKIISDWEGIFESALRSAVVDTDMTKEDFPGSCPWTFDQIMQEGWIL